ncbi:MAG: YgfZ/GcvT domain-containing protein [Microbacteriaceae bacterium]
MSNPFVDQRDLVGGTAVVRIDAAVVSVSGPDRAAVLNATLSQSLLGLSADDSREALELDGNGRIVRVLHVVERDEDTLLIVPGARGADVVQWLDKRVFMEDVAATDLTDDYVVYGGTVGFGDVVWVDPWPTIQPGGFTYGAERVPEWSYRESVIATDVPTPARVVDGSALDALRAVAGRPGLAEIDDRALPHELDWLRTAVHLSKGCYTGQETVAKIHNVGHPPRRLVRLHLDGSDSEFAVAGDAVMVDGEPVGVITTAGNHFEEGPVALARIKRTVPVDASITVDRNGHVLAATQEVIVPPTAGATAAERLRPSRP